MQEMHRHGYKQLNRDSYLSLSPSRPNKPEPPLTINRSGRMLQILVLVFRKKIFRVGFLREGKG